MQYSALSEKMKAKVDRAIGLSLGAVAKRESFGRGYEAVQEPFKNQRRPAVIELTGEDGILKSHDRARMINMHRDMMRNSPSRVAQDQQVRVNVVGSIGGKVYANFPAEFSEAAREVEKFVNKTWARHAEFTTGRDFNWILKTCLTSMASDGNVVLLFDDGFLTGGDGSGMIRAFEGDEIANIATKRLEELFGKGATQSQGIVHDRYGRITGCFVSSSQRGAETFSDKAGYITLRRDPLFIEAANWVLIGEERRFNQGRAVSALNAAISCFVDLHEITASETQAAKVNAQLVGQILRDATADQGIDGGAFDDDDGEEMPETIEFSTRELSSIGARFDQMPEGMKVDLLDTKRPNPNMSAFIEFLQGLTGGARGLARVYSTMRAAQSYTAFRGEQVMTYPSFKEMQKMLERDVCDPMIRLVIKWAVDCGKIKSRLPDNWEDLLSFVWPKMPEVSEVDAQKALALKLENGVTTLHRELQPGEYEAIMAEREKEIADYNRLGLVYPGTTNYHGNAVEPSTTKEENENE